MLGSGGSLRGMNNQGQIGRETTKKYIKHFRGIIEVFESHYLYNRLGPNQLHDIAEKYGEVSFPGVLVRFIA